LWLCPRQRQGRRLCGGAGTRSAQHHSRARHRLCDKRAGAVHQRPGRLRSDRPRLWPVHEIPDQLGILERLTKWAARIEHPTQTGRLVNEAFRQLRDGRPRPVGLEIPPDVLALETEVALPAAGGSPPITMPDPELIDKAAALLADAKKPLLFVGGGAVAAAEE